MSVRTSLLAVSLTGLLLTACAPEDDTTAAPAAASGSPSASAGAAVCEAASLKTRKPGTFTVGTDKPAYEPWFSGDDPTNGKGYESAVAYAVAQELGYARDDVTWVTAAFNSVIQPGEKPFDVDVNQVSITDERKKVVDFSTGYYDVAQAVIATKDSPIAGAKTLAELKDAKLGAQVGTTSFRAITEQIAPQEQPAVFDTNDVGKQQLSNGQIDGLVVDLPTAFFITAAELDDGVIVGQLPPAGTPEQFGMVLDKGSPLTSCVSQAVDALRSDGTLAKLQEQYLAGAGAPVLR